MSHDSSPPADVILAATSMDAATLAGRADEDAYEARSRFAILPGRLQATKPAQTLAPHTAELSCADVQGFREAELAASDLEAIAPARLVIVAPDDATSAWLERWAEDAEHVRRRLTLRRGEDGAEITIVATIASFGRGVPTALAVESIRPLDDGPIVRSGVHPKADVEAALARYDAARRAHEAKLAARSTDDVFAE